MEYGQREIKSAQTQEQRQKIADQYRPWFMAQGAMKAVKKRLQLARQYINLVQSSNLSEQKKRERVMQEQEKMKRDMDEVNSLIERLESGSGTQAAAGSQ